MVLGRHPALGPEAPDVGGDHVVVLRVEGAEQAGLGQLPHARVELGVIRHGQALELLLPALRGGVEESLVGHDPAVGGQLGDVLQIFAPGGPVEGEVHHTLGLRPGDTPLQDLHVVLGRHTDGLLQNGGHPAGGGGHSLGVESAPLSVARVPDVHVGIDGARDQVLPRQIQRLRPLRHALGRGDGGDPPGLDTHGDPLHKAILQIDFRVLQNQVQHISAPPLPSIRSDSGGTWPARRPASGHRPRRQTP